AQSRDGPNLRGTAGAAGAGSAAMRIALRARSMFQSARAMKQSPPPPSSSPGLKGQRHRWYSLRDEDPRGAFATAVIGATYKGHAAPRHPPVNLPSDATPDGDEDAGSPSIRPVLARGAIAW